MSKPNCYLCASDEGILLDIFGDAGKIFRENIETCLSVKVKQGEGRCTKICHRCAYELESCSRFLEKYRRSKDSKGAAACPKEEYCNLCAVTRDKAHLLRVNGGNSLKNSLCKIGQVIKEDLFKDKVADFAVCLDCRYNVDLLFDLRSVYRETPKKLESLGENGLSTSDLPKTRTSVILRKTTYIPLPRLNGDRNSDASTASSDTMSLKRKRGKPRKESVGTGVATALAVHFRSCEQCDTQVEHGIDMYRYHRTGLTVCKDCWLTIDPERVSSGKRKRLAQIDPEGGTKLCAVFLKDVLTNPSKYQNIYKLEKDEHGNTTFLITDESSENEDKTPPKRTRGRPSTSSLATLEDRKAPKRQSLAKRNEEETPKRGRPATRRSIEPPESPPIAKAKVKNGVADVDSTPTTTIRMRTRRGSAEPSKVASASPELRGSGVKKPSTKKVARPPKITSVKRASSGDEKSQTRAESSLNAARTDVDTQRITRARKISTPEQPTKRISRRTRSNSFTDPVTTEPLVTRRLAALSEEPSEETPIVVDATTPKISKTRPKIAKSDSELDKPYTCAVCQAGYANKLIGKAHELTHEKQPEVKLRRVVVPPETIAEETLPEASGKESEVANESCTLDGKTEAANESCTLDGKTEAANESCTLDGKTEEHDEKPNIEEEEARPVTPHITENKHDPEGTSDTSTLIIDNEKIAGDNNEKDERDESDETEVSLALRDTSDDESARTEKDGERMNGDENEAPDDRNVEVSGKNNVHENREKDEKTKDDVDESPKVTEPREIEDMGVTTCAEPKEMEVSKPNVNTTSAEDIETEATESSQATLPNKMEPVDDEKVENCAVETVPLMDDEPVKDVENIREIGADSEENLKNAVAAKPEVNEPVNDCTVTIETATERPMGEAQSDGKIDDESVEEEKMDEKKTERDEEEEEIKETKERKDKEDVGGVKEKSEEKKELAEQENENEDVRTNEKDEDMEEREEQETKSVEVSKNEKDNDTEERKENEKEVRNGKKDNVEGREENEMEEVKTNEKKKDTKQRDEKENEVEANYEKERKKVTEEKDKKEDEEEKEKEDEVEKQEKNEEDKEEENEEAKEKIDAEEKNEAEKEKDTDEREENGQKDEEEENGAKGKEGDTEKEQKEENENETEKENDAIKDEEEAEKTMRKDEEKEDELLGIELCDEPTDETQEGIDAKAESVGVATEVLREVFDLASAEVKKRLENKNSLEDNCATPETLENISLEIQNSADTPLSERSASNDKS